jgi:MFS family permease
MPPRPAEAIERGIFLRGGAVRVVALLMLVVAFGHFNRISISVAGTEQLIPNVKISETRMGMVYSGFLLCYTLAMLPGGWLIDRYGPKASLAVLCLGSTVFVALTGLTSVLLPDVLVLWGGLLLVRCLMGCVNAPLHPASAHMVGHRVPLPQVSFANGLVTFAACVGMAATWFVFAGLMDQLGWVGAFYASSALTFLVLLAWVVLAPGTDPHWSHVSTALPEKREVPGDARIQRADERMVEGSTIQGLTPERPEARASEVGASAIPARVGRVDDIFTHPGLICLTLSYAALGYFQYLFFYWVGYYFKEVLELSKDRSRLYSALVLLASGVGMALGGWLADRTSRWRGRGGRAFVPVVGLIGSGVVLLLGLMTAQAEVTLICFAGAMAALGMCEGPFWTTAVEIGGRRGGTTAALMNTGGNAGGLLAPVLTPQLSQYFGWRVGMGLASLVVVVGALLWVGIDPRSRLDPVDGPAKERDRT